MTLPADAAFDPDKDCVPPVDTYSVSLTFDTQREPPLHLLVKNGGGIKTVLDEPLKKPDSNYYDASREGGIQPAEAQELRESAALFRSRIDQVKGRKRTVALRPGESTQFNVDRTSNDRTEVFPASAPTIRFIAQLIAELDRASE